MKIKFNVACTAVYNSELELPDDIALRYKEDPKNIDNISDVLDFIREHLDEAHVEDLEWVADLDPSEAVMIEDLRGIEEDFEMEME